LRINKIIAVIAGADLTPAPLLEKNTPGEGNYVIIL
jgi:hypothetical protein